MQAWRLVRPGEHVVVLEEVSAAFAPAAQSLPPTRASDVANAPPQQDAQIDTLSVSRLHLLAQDISPRPWDVVLLDAVLSGFYLWLPSLASISGFYLWLLSLASILDPLIPIKAGARQRTGEGNTSWPTRRGREVRPRRDVRALWHTRIRAQPRRGAAAAAPRRRRHRAGLCSPSVGPSVDPASGERADAFLIHQVDALISLLATYEPSSLRLFWPTVSIAHASVWRPSSVWDGCVLRCMLPDAAQVLIPLVGVFLLATCARHFTFSKWR